MQGDETTPSGSTLSRTISTRVRRCWAERLSVPVDVFATEGPDFFVRDTATAVVVVALGDACVVLGPPEAMRQLGDLERNALLDTDTLTSRLAALDPTPIGSASLSYLEASPATSPATLTTPADASMVATLQSRVSSDEWDESGLATMPRRWVALTVDGDPAALAGFEPWGADLAHVGVVADPGQRGRGYAAAAVCAALRAAVDDGLVAQWRCRVGNTASERLATRLGFTLVGYQAAVALG